MILKVSSLRLQMYYWSYCGHSTDNYRFNDKFNLPWQAYHSVVS